MNTLLLATTDNKNAFTAFVSTILLTGLCSTPEQEYSREIIGKNGNIEIEMFGGDDLAWPKIEFSVPVNMASLENENGELLVVAQCTTLANCFVGIDIGNCEPCFIDENSESCWWPNQSSTEGMDCSGREEVDVSEESGKYAGEFTLTIETVDGKITTFIYQQEYIEKDSSCGWYYD